MACRSFSPVKIFDCDVALTMPRQTHPKQDVSASVTLMVGCLYDPAKIEDWHEDYAGEGKRNVSPRCAGWRGRGAEGRQ
jgi:hypothetical protein